jgi:hypothetical protein
VRLLASSRKLGENPSDLILESRTSREGVDSVRFATLFMSQKQEQAQFMLTEVVFSSKIGVANLEQYRSRRTVATFVF